MPAARVPRAPRSTTTDAANATDTTADDAAAQAQEHALAVQRQQFNMLTEEHAEFERERQALEDLMLAQLKNEDEILKKWIALI